MEKLKIIAHNDPEMQTQVGEFILPVNPEQYAQKFQVKYDGKVAPGATGVASPFKSSAPEELRLDFTFDGTDTIYGYVHKGKTVTVQIQEFKDVVYVLDGEIHQPRFLKVFGTNINFPCILSDLQITYTLFKPDGTPLRAKISATFMNFKEVHRRVSEENKNSPDLTHIRPVNDGDKLALMAFRIYKDTKYYLEVAKVNGLTNFRQLRTGQDVIFPPIEKNTSA